VKICDFGYSKHDNRSVARSKVVSTAGSSSNRADRGSSECTVAAVREHVQLEFAGAAAAQRSTAAVNKTAGLARWPVSGCGVTAAEVLCEEMFDCRVITSVLPLLLLLLLLLSGHADVHGARGAAEQVV
jgi:hypothetical protein